MSSRRGYREQLRNVYGTAMVRALNKGLPATLTPGQWIENLDYYGWRCAYCGFPADTLDHFIPLSLGSGTTMDNVVPACRRDNQKKQGRHPSFVPDIPQTDIQEVRAYLEQFGRVRWDESMVMYQEVLRQQHATQREKQEVYWRRQAYLARKEHKGRS